MSSFGRLRQPLVTALVLAAFVLAACSEKAERPDPEGPRAWGNEKPQNPLHERTRNQGESERIGH